MSFLSGTLIGAATAFTVWRNRNPTVDSVGQTAVGSVNAARNIGFVVWLAVASAFSLGIFLIGIYTVSISWGLSGLGQALGIAVMVIYFVVATLFINWAIRGRGARPQFAWLIPLAAIFIGVVPIAAVAIIAEVL